VEKIWKSVNIWRSYGQYCSALFFWLRVYMGRKSREVGSVPFLGMGLGSQITKSPGLRPTFMPSVIYPSSRLDTICMGRMFWGSCPFWGGWLHGSRSSFNFNFGGGEQGPHLTQCSQGWGLPAYQVSSWSVQPFGHNTPTPQTGQTDRQADRTDNGLIAYGEPFYKRSPKNPHQNRFLTHSQIGNG